MRKIIKYLFLLLAVAAIVSCQPKPIDIDIAPQSPKLVVASQVVPNSIMIVALTRSFSALQNAAQNDTAKKNILNGVLVNNAIVTVSYSGKTDTLKMITAGLYASLNTLLSPGDVYTLKARDSEKDLAISAVTAMLPQVKFDTVRPQVIITAVDTTVKLNLAFTDPPAEQNYYVINYYNNSKKAGATVDVNSYFGFGSNKLIDFELISDQTFAAGQYTEEYKMKGVHATDTIAVTLSNISEGYFKFLTAYKRSGSLIQQLTGEPINYPTNVVNGYGYFNAHYPDVKYFYLKNY